MIIAYVSLLKIVFISVHVQWRAQKIFMGGFWFRVVWWSFVFGVRCL